MLCAELDIPPQYPVATQIWIAFRHLLRNNISLLYDRHVDQLILCTTYGVCKMMKFSPTISFAKIIDIYTDMNKQRLGEAVCQRITRHIKLDCYGAGVNDIDFHLDGLNPQRRKQKSYGNIIYFYNQTYVPAMKQHLLRSASIKKASLDLKKIMAAQNAKETIRNIHDATIFADQAYASMGTVNDNIDSNFASPTNENYRVPSVASPIRVQKRSFYVSQVPKITMPSEIHKYSKKSNWDSVAPRSRVLINFGSPSVKDISLINEHLSS